VTPPEAPHLIARGRPSLLAVSQIALAVANLALTILLLLETREIWTAAFATLVVQIAGALLLLPLLARREGMPYAAVVVSWGTPVAVGILAAVPTLVVARVLTDTDSLLVLAVVGAYWAAVFSALAWRLALTRGERTMVRGLARRGRATIPAAEV